MKIPILTPQSSPNPHPTPQFWGKLVFDPPDIPYPTRATEFRNWLIRYLTLPCELFHKGDNELCVKAAYYHSHINAPAMCLYAELHGKNDTTMVAIGIDTSWSYSTRSAGTETVHVSLMRDAPVEPWGGLYPGDMEWLREFFSTHIGNAEK